MLAQSLETGAAVGAALRFASTRARCAMAGLRAPSVALAAVLVVALPAPLLAEPTELADTPATLTLDDRWRAVEPAAQYPPTLPADQLGPARWVAAFRRPDRRARRGDKPGAALVVVRFDAPNQVMWRKSTRRAALETLEEALGVSCAAAAAASRCAKLGDRKELMLGQVPAAQWRARARDRTVLVRMLFFRTYTLTAMAEVPRGSRELAAARAAIESFAPPTTTP